MSDYITVQTNPATDVGVNQMTLNGELSLLDTSVYDMAICYFFYSTSVDEDGNLIDPIRIPDSGDVGLFDVGGFSFVLDGLSSDTQYHFQAEGKTIVYTDSGAMEYITESVTRTTHMLLDPNIVNALWSKEAASELFWKAGTPEPPRTFIVGGADCEITLPVESGRTVLHFVNSANGDDYAESVYWEMELDLTDINTLHIKTKADELGGGSSELKIWVGGIEVFSTENTHGWTDRNFDVSGVTGIKTLGLGGNIAGQFGPDVHSWADIRLE